MNRSETEEPSPGKPAPKPALLRLWHALNYSVKGLIASFRFEQAFRQEIYAALALMPLGYWLGDSGAERAILIGSVLLVMVVELINSAIESVVDRLGPEHHELSGRAKDQGSAAVLVALILSAVAWVLVLLG